MQRSEAIDVDMHPDRSSSEELNLLSWLQAIGGARRQHGLAAEEALIFLAVGQLGLRFSNDATMVWPVTCLEISDLLQIPRETVRRKTGRLIENDWVAVTGRGFVLKNVEQWRKFAARFSK